MSCGKIIHLTRESAEGHADRLEEETGVRPDVYQCDKCNNLWHVGHTPALKQKLSKKSRRIQGSQRNGGMRKRSIHERKNRNGADWANP